MNYSKTKTYKTLDISVYVTTYKNNKHNGRLAICNIKWNLSEPKDVQNLNTEIKNDTLNDYLELQFLATIKSIESVLPGTWWNNNNLIIKNLEVILETTEL
jgi:hypothetical protein